MMKKQAKTRAKTDDTATEYGPCTAQHCANQAVSLCPCGMALCAACLARHARFLSADYLMRREQEDEAEQAEQAPKAKPTAAYRPPPLASALEH